MPALTTPIVVTAARVDPPPSERIAIEVPAIIAPETFKAARALLQSRAQVSRHG